jgi:predicted phosphodiesterase
VSKLPPLNSPEWEELKKKALDGQADSLWQPLGFGSKPRFLEAMRRRGIKISELPIQHSLAEQPAQPEVLSDIEQAVLAIVQREVVSVGEISRRIDHSSETVIKTIDALRAKHYEVILDEISHEVSIPQEPTKQFAPTEFRYFRKSYRIGLVADPHLCSRFQQLTLLHDAYAEFDKRKVDFVLNAGDLVDGKNMYRGQANEVFKQGADEQADYVIKTYPKLGGGVKTYIIGGNHDASFFRDSGLNIIRAVCKERKDLVDKGFFKAEFIIKGLRVGLQHPSGGVSYARSYKMQKIIENMMGFIHSIPTAEAPILQLFGHWHIPCHLPSYMGIDAVSLPCFQSQTPYLEQKGLMPVVGYAIAEINLDGQKNLSRTNIEFFNLNSRIIKNDY